MASNIETFPKKFFGYAVTLSGFLVEFRHSINIVIFYALNSQFRKTLNRVVW